MTEYIIDEPEETPPWWAVEPGKPVELRRIGDDFVATDPETGQKWLIRAKDVYPVREQCSGDL